MERNLDVEMYNSDASESEGETSDNDTGSSDGGFKTLSVWTGY